MQFVLQPLIQIYTYIQDAININGYNAKPEQLKEIHLEESPSQKR